MMSPVAPQRGDMPYAVRYLVDSVPHISLQFPSDNSGQYEYKAIQGFDPQPYAHERINLSRAQGVMNHLEGLLIRELNLQDVSSLGKPQFNSSMVKATAE